MAIEQIELTCPVCGKTFKRAKSKYLREKERRPDFIPCCSHSCARLNCKPRSWKPAVFENPNGNFLFGQADLDRLRMNKDRDLKELQCKCMSCGKTFHISYSDYQDILSKIKKTEGSNIGKYCSRECFGKDYSTRYDAVLEKRNDTILNNYGSKEAFYETHKSKRETTLLERYGTTVVAHIPNISTQKKFTRRESHYGDLVAQLFRKNIVIDTSYDKFIKEETVQYRCLKCGHTWESDTTDQHYIYCSECYKQPYSNKEKELVDYVRSIYDGTIIENDRKILNGKELDLYLPDLNLAIEFNGNYWHSDAIVSSTKHLEKTLGCKEKGIRLIHIFEYEWDTMQDKLKNFLKQCMGLFDHRVYARQCEVREITYSVYRDFLEQYHLQGAVNSPTRYGLFYDNELVSVIGIGQSRFTKNDLELHRFCVKAGWQIVGGFGKLLSAVQHLGDIVSYIDYSKFDGKGYFATGFEEVEQTKPNFVWFKGTTILKRYATQKHKLPELLGEEFNPNETEVENMTRMGFMRIYDCGNLKVILRKK